MNGTDLLANRLIHIAILTVVAVALVLYFADQPTIYRLTIALSPLVTWMMGKYYERSIILQADLVDEEELRTLERNKASILFRQ